MYRLKKAPQVLSFILGLFLFPGVLFASEMDVLVNKLVEKGLFTREDAREVLEDMKEEAKVESEKTQIANTEPEVIPEWIKNTQVKGDIRMRYQWEKRKGSGNQNERVRMRTRLGVNTKVGDKAGAHVRFATGSRDDLRSTNQTLGGNSNEAFGHYDIWLDEAYIDYAACSSLKLLAGKMPLKKVFWQAGDMLFDTDINPDGASAAFNKSLGDKADLFANTGWWILQDGSQSADVSMAYIQPGIKTELNKKTTLKLAAAYLQYNSLKGKDIDEVISSRSSDTNSLDDFGGLKYDFNSWIANAEVGFTKPLAFMPSIHYIGVFGDYVNNPDPGTDNTGYLAGFKFGDKKIAEQGQWQGKYMYRKIGKDAVVDIFPDSDALGGKTDMKAHELIFEYGLSKNIIFGLDYYMSERLKDSSNDHSKEHLLQTDIVYEF